MTSNENIHNKLLFYAYLHIYYCFQIRYHKNSGEQQPTDLKIPSCDVMCPFHEFKRLQKHILPIITIEEACRPSSVDNDKLLF